MSVSSPRLSSQPDSRLHLRRCVTDLTDVTPATPKDVEVAAAVETMMVIVQSEIIGAIDARQAAVDAAELIHQSK